MQKFFAAPSGAAKARKDNPNSLSNPLQIQPVLWYKERGPPQFLRQNEVALCLSGNPQLGELCRLVACDSQLIPSDVQDVVHVRS